MHDKKALIMIIMILGISIACTMPGITINAPDNQDAQVQTAAAKTVIVALTLDALQQPGAQNSASPEQAAVPADNENSSEPTNNTQADAPIVETTEAPTATYTITPTPTYTPSITPTPIPCNRGHFVSDVTIPDDTEVNPGSSFIKTWRLKNTGSCTWTPDYDLVFHNGDRMGAPDAVALSGNVNPGSTVDISVSLTAPGDAGTYRGNFKLRAADNTIFGINNDAAGSFYVRIVVPEPTEVPPSSTQSDLQITAFTLNPATPIQGQPVHVTITVMNKGNAVTGPYKVEWWAGENFPSAACSWNVDNSNPNGGRVLECDYGGYTSWYASIVTKVVADPDGTVSESNETNNVSKMTIAVNKP